jgi:hypothetical protein
MKWRSKGSADAAATEAIGTVPQFDTRLDSFDDLGDEADVTSATQDPQYNASTPPTYNQSQEMSKSAPPPRPNAPPTSQPGSSTNVAVKTNTVNQPTPAAQSATQLSCVVKF